MILSALLHHMGEFVRDQATTRLTLRLVHSAREDDLVADRISQCTDGISRLRGLTVGMYAHRREVVSEASFHGGSRVRVERPAGRTQDVADDRRNVGCAGVARP